MKGRPYLPVPWTRAGVVLVLAALAAWALPARAQDSVCAQVRIEIKQELTLERQAFDAEMRISNGLDSGALESVSVNVTFADQAGNAVRATSDPNDTTAQFFIRIDTLSGISNVAGQGRVAPSSTAEIHWLIIPSAGAGGTTAAGKLYMVGATLAYTLAGERQTVQVAPDSIYVKPLPKLTLDYFLAKDVYSDDPFTAAIEPPEPFTLGVRVKNNGAASAREVKIESAQPKIVDNKQGLLVSFQILASFVNDQPTSNSLRVSFGEIASQKASSGRWSMISSLSGKFVDFTATFTHADELGGVLTSILEKTNVHFLVKDVRVDLPGRDLVRDFLALDGDTLRIYESDSGDTLVTNQSAASSLAQGATTGPETLYQLNAPPTAGFFYVKLPDPFRGVKSVGRVMRSDGKVMAPENAWLSKSRNASNQWDYFISFFDANSTGRYTLVMTAQDTSPKAPVFQPIADRTVKEGQAVSLLVQATDPNGDAVKLSAVPLPTGAHFTDVGNGNGVLDWTPLAGQAGLYSITYRASDGALDAAQTARITVQPDRASGPDIPAIAAPVVNGEARVLRPILVVQSANPLDRAQRYFFEVYGDESLSVMVAQGDAQKGADSTVWKLPLDLTDNTRYFWRARAFDGTTYSEWANARFFVNLDNEPPAPPIPSAPRDGTQVDTLTPVLSVSNSVDPDGDAVAFGFEVYADSAATQVVASVQGVPVGPQGTTAWQVPVQLSANRDYYWRATASDPHGALTETPVLRFTVDPNNHRPAAPVVASPAPGAVVAGTTLALVVSNATDPDGDTLTYSFELDRSRAFNSPAKRASGPVQSGGGTTSWSVGNLSDNTRYTWRARAHDGRGNGAWVTGEFLVSAADEAPPTPVLRNVGPGSWVDSARPRLEAAPVADPEGGLVTYHFQVYADAALQSLVTEAQLGVPEWLLPVSLGDQERFYWRVRALDQGGKASAWSQAAGFTVLLNGAPVPVITLTSPATIVEPGGASVTIAWEVRDPENNTTISLYYDRDDNGADGTLIAEGIHQDATHRTGEYAWNTSGLTPGAYHVYAVASNDRRSSLRYAPGTVVIPSPAPKGTVLVKTTSWTTTTEAGASATFQLSLGSAPSSEVVIGVNSTRPDEGSTQPKSVTFNSGNWNVPQTITVTGVNDCIVDGDIKYRVIVGRALTADPNYAGAKGQDLSYVNVDNDSPSTGGPLATCNFRGVSSKRVSLFEWDYVMVLDVTNLGPDAAGATGTVTSSVAAITIIDGSVTFAPIPSGATATSLDTFTIRQDRRFAFDPAFLRWSFELR